MSDMIGESTSGAVAETKKSTPCSSKASIRAATNKARRMFSKPDPETLSSSDTVSDEEDDYDTEFKLLKAMEEIQKLKKATAEIIR